MSYKKWRVLAASAEQTQDKGKLPEAEAGWLSALEEAEDLGRENPMLILTLERLAEVLFLQGKYAYCAPICRRLLVLYQEMYGDEAHPSIGILACNLGMIYHAWHKYADAEPLYNLALRIKVKTLGDTHPEVLSLAKQYAGLLQSAAATKSGRWTRSGNWEAISFSMDEQLSEKSNTTVL
jgi:tetratricopeptide (TPR) repeat protein